ncbi:STY4851/ECs_5259 family protein [Vibrio campbellii]|uniref:STY4851/ECs_5259 family protein n=1 Tax=Vibrio campbellii TaxID=680 RepID=UPI0020CA95DE|nr:STY4851/ECs_5259 family protein [Vibrio campbellii]
MQTYRNVLSSILNARELTKPNAQPIYSYKVTVLEFELLKQSLIASLESHGIHTYSNKPTREWAGCFVLYAAEWWRTSFQGGVWAWEPVLESLGLQANAISPTQRSEIVAKGLSFWGRKVLSNTKGRMLLGTVAVEGGLPQTLIQDPNSRLAHYFEQVIQDYGQFANSRLSAVSVAKAHAHHIAASYRDETVYSIVAQVAESIYYLVDKHGLDEQSDPLHYLNTVDANWSQGLPLNMEPEAARTLLGNALGLAVEVQRRLPNSIKILRSLRKSYSHYAAMMDISASDDDYHWQNQVGITLKSRLNAKFLQQLFSSVNLPDRINLFAVGSKSLLLAKAFKRGADSEYYLLDVYTKSLPAEWFDCDIQLKATDDAGHEWFAPVLGGAGVDANGPWVFTQHNDEWLLKGGGNVECAEANALVSVPERLSHPTLAKVGHINGRVLYDVNTQIDTEFYFDAYRVSLGREGVQPLEFNLVGQAIPYQANPSRCIARSIAVLMRNQLAEKLGINNDEIGCTTKPVNHEGREVQAIVLFDNAAGGAGFSIQASEYVVELLQGASSCHCDKACHRCLVDYSTQHVLDLLDRRKVATYLSNGFFNNLSLPVEYELFDHHNKRELRPIMIAIEKTLAKYDDSELYVELPVSQLSDLGDWQLYQAFSHWVAERKVNLILTEAQVQELSIEQKVTLSWYQNHPNVKVMSKLLNGHAGHQVLASVANESCCYQWGNRIDDLETLVVGIGSLGELVDFDPTRLRQSSDVEKIVIDNELDGKASEFGFKFWTLVFKRSPTLMKLMQNQVIESVTYSDRYLAATLPVSLCFNALKFIGDYYKNCQVEIHTGELSRGCKPATVQDNFFDDYSRDKVIGLAFESTAANMSFKTTSKYKLPHSRTLVLSFDNGKQVALWLDQGFGYWYADKRLSENHLPYDLTDTEHAKIIAEGRSKISSGDFPTDIFVSFT